MQVRDVMTTDVLTVGPEASFAELVDALLTRGVSGLPVVDESGRLLGIVTEADLVSKEAYGPGRRRALALVADYFRGRDPQWVRKSSGLRASELMTAEPDSVTPDDDVVEVARRMLERHHKRLPVLVDGRVVGIVSRHDLLQSLGRHRAG
jgi:CBS domain-containing protein